MKKKMTLKEFKETLNKAGNDFDVWGYEGILNLLCIAWKYQIEQDKDFGLYVIAEETENKRNFVYKELVNRGYYNN